MAQDDLKHAAAIAALAELPPAPCVIGLGTGSTARHFVAALAERVRAGERYTGVPTSEETRQHALALGIPLLDDDGPWDIALTVDGADEVDDMLNLLKGGGGAHTREKIVNHGSARNVIVVDEGKRSRRLGERRPVPVEVLRFAHRTTAGHLARHGQPTLRLASGLPVLTDAGNYLYDLHVGPIADPRALDRQLHAIPGVVETGLFIARADLVLVATPHGVERLAPPRG